jgi:hypothetical protein
MKFNATVTKEFVFEVELKPGDRVELDGFETDWFNRPFYVVRLVETRNTTYAIFSNKTWRPISSYGRTWRKLDKNGGC